MQVQQSSVRYVAAAGAMCFLPIRVDMAIIGQLHTILSVAAGDSFGLISTGALCCDCALRLDVHGMSIASSAGILYVPKTQSASPQGIFYVLAAAFVQKGIFGTLTLTFNALTGICLSMGLLGGYIEAVGLQREMLYSGQDLGRLLSWLCGLVTRSRRRVLMPFAFFWGKKHLLTLKNKDLPSELSRFRAAQ